jgi:hypothetical protein
MKSNDDCREKHIKRDKTLWMNKTSFRNTNLNEISTISNLKINYLLAANSHFYTVLISCLHQCFANLNFRRNSQIKRHFYFLRYLHTYLHSCFHDCKRENLVFKVTLKSSLNCHYLVDMPIAFTFYLSLYSWQDLLICTHLTFFDWLCNFVSWVIEFVMHWWLDLHVIWSIHLAHWLHKKALVLWLNPWYKSFYTTHVT